MTDETTMVDAQEALPVDAQEAPEESAQETDTTTETAPAQDDNQVKSLRAENAKRRTELRAAEERIKALEREKMNDTERAQSERDEAVARAKALEERLRVEALTSETLTAAASLNLVDGNDAVRLLDADAIEYDDTGRPSNLTQLLASLVEQKPYLVRHAAAQRPDGGDTPGRGGQVPAKPKETIQERRARLRQGGRPGGGDVFDPGNAAANGGGVFYEGKNLFENYAADGS